MKTNEIIYSSLKKIFSIISQSTTLVVATTVIGCGATEQSADSAASSDEDQYVLAANDQTSDNDSDFNAASTCSESDIKKAAKYVDSLELAEDTISIDVHNEDFEKVTVTAKKDNNVVRCARITAKKDDGGDFYFYYNGDYADSATAVTNAKGKVRFTIYGSSYPDLEDGYVTFKHKSDYVTTSVKLQVLVWDSFFQ